LGIYVVCRVRQDREVRKRILEGTHDNGCLLIMECSLVVECG